MNPTNKLRFVERYVNKFGDLVSVRVLQQWWESDLCTGEWRDVPLEEETK